MATFDEVLGHMLARTEDPNIKKVLSAFDVEKSRSQNASTFTSSRFLLRKDIDPTITFLAEYTSDHYPHAAPYVEDTINSGKQKSEKVNDMIDVLFAISPSQCRACKKTYISTSPENSDATLKCLICGRRSHADCYKDYTVDNSVGIVFLCDPCLTTSETASALEHLKEAEKKPDSEDKGDEKKDVAPSKEDPPSKEDEICPLYKENSCPHGLTGKRNIDGKPCSFRHPPNCFYHIGKYGNHGCRYTAKKCPFFHPALCENSVKMQVCLNKECKKYHLKGTRRFMNDPTPKETKDPNKDQRKKNQNSAYQQQSSNRRQRSNTSVWEENNEDTEKPKKNANPENQSQETNINALFLGCIQQLNSNINQMKAEMNQNIREIVKNTLVQNSYPGQNPQTNTYISPMNMLTPQMKLHQLESLNMQSQIQPQSISAPKMNVNSMIQQPSQ